MSAIIERDVIVVGAGPAGSICAAYMAKAGLDVLLLDKDLFPRDKPCADMLCEGVVKHLTALETIDEIDEQSACIRRLRLIGSNGKTADMPFECYTIQRQKLDSILTRMAVSWGAEFRSGCRVIDVIKEKNVVRGVVVKQKGSVQQIRARLVIGADGVNSFIGKSSGEFNENSESIWLGLRAYYQNIKLDRRLLRAQYDAGGIFGFDDNPGPAYFWIVPVGKDAVSSGLCNVGMIVKGRNKHRPQMLQNRMKAWLESDERIRAVMQDAEMIGEWKMGKLSDYSQGRITAGNGYMLIGDAASLMKPLTCDGLSAAADSAKGAAIAAVNAFNSEDFSQAALLASAERDGDKFIEQSDEMKTQRLLMESMRDPQVMNMIIERMAEK